LLEKCTYGGLVQSSISFLFINYEKYAKIKEKTGNKLDVYS
jgi:hypothetical protein